MSAEIISFIAHPKRDRQASDFPTIVFRTVSQTEKAATDDPDTAPCEYLPPVDGES
jgi:hypothetical protein